MRLLREENKGFTLLELILALGIVGFIVVISLGAIRLGASAQDAGNLKVDTFQRLRLIENQLTQKIKSTYPVFKILDQSVFASKNLNKKSERILAFEGTTDSIRFVTFSSPLTSQRKPPWMHETTFYLGEHPITGKSGIIMGEKKISENFNSKSTLINSEQEKLFILAENVAYLKFRYYKVKKLNPNNLKSQNNKSVEFEGKWISSIKVNSSGSFKKFTKEKRKHFEFEKNNKISLPRAVEISLGLYEKSNSDLINEPKIIYSPPIVVPLYSGMSFALPLKQDEST